MGLTTIWLQEHAILILPDRFLPLPLSWSPLVHHQDWNPPFQPWTWKHPITLSLSLSLSLSFSLSGEDVAEKKDEHQLWIALPDNLLTSPYHSLSSQGICRLQASHPSAWTIKGLWDLSIQIMNPKCHWRWAGVSNIRFSVWCDDGLCTRCVITMVGGLTTDWIWDCFRTGTGSLPVCSYHDVFQECILWHSSRLHQLSVIVMLPEMCVKQWHQQPQMQGCFIVLVPSMCKNEP